MTFRRNHYHNYDEMSAWLLEVTERFPDRARLESIGKTPEGRDIWVVAITRFERGDASNKPAYWIDGNTHASEVLGCEACLRTIDLLMERWEDEEVVRLMTNRAMYICPRISADGADGPIGGITHKLVAAQEAGATVFLVPAENGDEAFRRLGEDLPDLILMDVVMPGQNGFQLTRTITRDPRWSDVPVIMCTSKNQETDKVWGMRQGARDYIVKPVNADELLSKIRAFDAA